MVYATAPAKPSEPYNAELGPFKTSTRFNKSISTTSLPYPVYASGTLAPSIKMFTLLPPNPRMEIPSLYMRPYADRRLTPTPGVVAKSCCISLTMRASISASEIEETDPTTSLLAIGFLLLMTTTS